MRLSRRSRAACHVPCKRSYSHAQFVTLVSFATNFLAINYAVGLCLYAKISRVSQRYLLSFASIFFLSNPSFKINLQLQVPDPDIYGTQHGWIITCSVKCRMKLTIHFQTSMVAPLKFAICFHPALCNWYKYSSKRWSKVIHVSLLWNNWLAWFLYTALAWYECRSMGITLHLSLHFMADVLGPISISVRSREVSTPRDWYFKLSYRF